MDGTEILRVVMLLFFFFFPWSCVNKWDVERAALFLPFLSFYLFFFTLFDSGVLVEDLDP